MRKNNIKGEEAKELFGMLCHNVKLDFIDLKDNDLDNSCAIVIIDLL